MNKINGCANMKVSAEKPATTHTHNRQGQAKKNTKDDKFATRKYQK